MKLERLILHFFCLLLVGFLTTVSAFGQIPEPAQTLTRPTGSERIEKKLSEDWYYNIPRGVSVLDWFNSLAKILEADLVYHPENGERSQLMLGDAYHWIGHIFEDRGELDRAWEAYNKSYQHYLLTREKFSPMINSLDGREHAKMHLWRIVEKDPSKKVIYGIRDVRQEQDVPENKSQAKQDYRNEIDVIIKRSNIPTPHVLCGLLVGK